MLLTASNGGTDVWVTGEPRGGEPRRDRKRKGISNLASRVFLL